MLHFLREHFKIEFLLRTDLSEVVTVDFIDNSVKCCICIDFQKLLIFNLKLAAETLRKSIGVYIDKFPTKLISSQGTHSSASSEIV